ncbi:MAG: 4-alpha-glucanotransferase, partial [Deltaproteobacteria bacterium]|nr:4-alpha-glucanotransferase [Deltaproteobacteria bacterium]
MGKRGSGILLHIISLPSSFGIGDMGPEAYRFIDFLNEAKQRIWQILPLNPTEPIHNHSPYHSTSAFAGNPLLISPDLLVRDDFLTPSDLEGTLAFPLQKVDYRAAHDFKGKILEWAYRRFKNQKAREEYEAFCRENRHWLDDFALFIAIKLHCHGQGWSDWAPDLRDRQKEALLSAQRELSGAVERGKFFQYIFFKQWKQLKK